MTIHPQEAQIPSLSVEEASIPSENSDYAMVFSKHSATDLLKHTGINDHAIDMLDNKQSPYGPIYNLGLVELETEDLHRNQIK